MEGAGAGRDLILMSLGDIFDEAFELYKTNFRLFAGIVAVVQAPGLAVYDWLTYVIRIEPGVSPGAGRSDQLNFTPTTLMLFFVFVLLWWVVSLVQNGTLTLAISRRYLGYPASVGAAYRGILPMLPRILSTTFLLTVILTGLFFVVAIPAALVLGMVTALAGAAFGSVAVAAALATIGVMLVVGLVLGMVMVWFGLFVIQIVVLEGAANTRALQRNMDLVRGSFWRLFGAAAALVLVSYGVTATIEASLMLLMQVLVFQPAQVPQVWQHVAVSIWTALVSMFLQPYPLIALTLLYYDRRIRKEGFDIAWLERMLVPAAGGAAS
ncbi:MAG: hypothetical protein ACP5VE_12225 [Chthonomonadales bacterium]